MKTIYIHTNEQITERKTKKIVKKIKRENKEKDITVVLSRDLDEDNILKEKLNENKIKVLNGRWLFKFLIFDVVEYITKYNKTSIETQNIVFLLNEADDIIIEQIIKLANKARFFKIVSNNINKFRFIEEKLYRDYGIAIQVTNNQNKSLLKATIIINVDLSEENIKEYSLNPYAILVNVKHKVSNNLLNFKGTNINYYKVEYNKENFVEPKNAYYFESNILYESYIYRRDTFSNIYNQLKQDGVRLIELI